MATNDYLPKLRAELETVQEHLDRIDDQGDTAAIVRIRRMLASLHLRISQAERRITGS